MDIGRPMRVAMGSSVDRLIDVVSRRAGLTPAQSRAAVAAVLDYLTANLPSPVVGRIRELLQGGAVPPPAQNGGNDDSLP
jgi:hypothetical protein